jgi:serine/threonine protein kinase
VIGLSDAAVTRLRSLGRWPAFESGRYSVLEEIGRGGMGTVYLARDEELGREVAIKIPNALASTELERRLAREARVLAALEHPGIVPIHDFGRLADGRLFYVMKRVNGRTLREHLPDVLDEGERLRLFERILEPVAFAHAHGVIHRDLTPRNIMVGTFGEVMVMDWGVAKVMDGDARQSSVVSRDSSVTVTVASHSRQSSPVPVVSPGLRSSSVVGTVGFMAPEQAQGAGEAVDHRADVYGLGAILFFLFAGRDPGADDDPVARLRQFGVRRPLAAICGRALEKDAGARYHTVAALAADIAAYRAGRAVSAYRETVVERALRFGRAHRTAILLVLAYVIMRAVVALVAGR